MATEVATSKDESASAVDNDEQRQWYSVKCHCGRVKGKFMASKTSITAWNCNCSDCIMRGNVHVIIPEDDFQLDMVDTDDDKEAANNAKLEEETTLYLWGTKTAKRRFCKTCGILPWYRPRSNPDGYGITLNCIDFDENNKPDIKMEGFDGQNWENFFQQSNISEQSKKS